MDEKERDTVLIIGIVVLYFIWFYVISPAVKWLQENWLLVQISIGVIIAVIVLAYLYMRRENKKKERELKIKTEIKKAEKQAIQHAEMKKKAALEKEQMEERERFIEIQRSKGLVSFIDRNGAEKWGTPSKVKKWTKEDEIARLKESLFYKITKSIEEFKPDRVYRDEFGYHRELLGWLKREFPDAISEVRKGASRPDIVIGNIAIEVKGPTRTRDLVTLSDKMNRYSHHFEKIILVLFETDVSEKRYEEMIEGFKHTRPNWVVIRKS